MDLSLSKRRELVKDRETWRATVHGVAELAMIERLNNDDKALYDLNIACCFAFRLALYVVGIPNCQDRTQKPSGENALIISKLYQKSPCFRYFEKYLLYLKRAMGLKLET